jgi:hypothetical protein
MRSFSLWPLRSACASSFLVLALVLAFSGPVLAQKYVVANATIPFAFEAGGEVFAAGDYTVDSSVPTFVFIRSKDGKHVKEVPTVIYGEPVKKSEAKLVFVKRDGRYFLQELWGVLGRRRMTSELTDKLVVEKETRQVPLTYPPGGGA